MSRNYVQTFSTGNSYTVYQGETFTVENTHTKIIVLHTTDFVFIFIPYKLILSVFFIKYIWVFTEHI